MTQCTTSRSNEMRVKLFYTGKVCRKLQFQSFSNDFYSMYHVESIEETKCLKYCIVTSQQTRLKLFT